MEIGEDGVRDILDPNDDVVHGDIISACLS